MPRLSGKLLGGLVLAALVAHAAWLGPPILAGARLENGLDTLLGLFAACLCGRIVLAWLPPGDPGEHAPRALPVTVATSLALGLPLTTRLEGRTALGIAGAILAVGLLARALTLPGAMVPRHGVTRERWRTWESLLALACVAWVGVLALTPEGPARIPWFALALLVFHALGVARRARAGRWAVLALGAFAPQLFGLVESLPALALGLGASALVPWLRRHDRRAGALAALGFGSAFLHSPSMPALAGALVFVLASRPRQRLFALTWVGAVGAVASVLARAGPTRAAPPLEGASPLRTMLDAALDLGHWGLAWPLVAVGLGLGALFFPWRTRWSPGAIEPPRREVLALLALILADALVLAVTRAAGSASEALVLLFWPCALVVGLLVLPAECQPTEGRNRAA